MALFTFYVDYKLPLGVCVAGQGSLQTGCKQCYITCNVVTPLKEGVKCKEGQTEMGGWRTRGSVAGACIIVRTCGQMIAGREKIRWK